MAGAGEAKWGKVGGGEMMEGPVGHPKDFGLYSL